jgi:hypothetical protein
MDAMLAISLYSYPYLNNNNNSNNAMSFLLLLISSLQQNWRRGQVLPRSEGVGRRWKGPGTGGRNGPMCAHMNK